MSTLSVKVFDIYIHFTYILSNELNSIFPSGNTSIDNVCISLYQRLICRSGLDTAHVMICDCDLRFKNVLCFTGEREDHVKAAAIAASVVGIVLFVTVIVCILVLRKR